MSCYFGYYIPPYPQHRILQRPQEHVLEDLKVRPQLIANLVCERGEDEHCHLPVHWLGALGELQEGVEEAGPLTCRDRRFFVCMVGKMKNFCSFLA